jgi:hypothetical protein
MVDKENVTDDVSQVKEKIRIDIKEIKPKVKANDLKIGDMGIKIRRISANPPMSDNFVFTPQILPSLREYVEEVRWDSVEKRLYVKIQETPDFSAYRWFSQINERQSNVDGIDFDTDVVFMSFLDECDREVARFKFTGINLKFHNCIVGQQSEFSVFGIEGEPSPLLGHSIELSYKKVEQVKKEYTMEDDSEGFDEEWKTVEVP